MKVRVQGSQYDDAGGHGGVRYDDVSAVVDANAVRSLEQTSVSAQMLDL